MIRFIMLLLVLALNLFSMSIYADTSLHQVMTEFEQRLEQSQKRYQRVNDQLLEQRRPQLRRLQRMESQLVELRQQLAGHTRSKDEQFVSLQSMKQRLSQWQQQNRYIDNLLSRYLGTDADIKDNQLFAQRLNAIGQATRPGWKPSQVVSLNGRIINGQQLNAGPLSWFIDEQDQGYFVDSTASPPTLVMKASHPLTDLQAMPVDISQNKAIRIAASEDNLLAKLEHGGIWVYPILLLGALTLLVATCKLVALSRLSALQPQLAQRALEGEKPDTEGWQKQMYELAYRHRNWPKEALADKLHHQLLRWKANLDSKMVMLTATAAVAPLLGLLGTVSGMIHTFEMMNLFGNQDQNMLAGGISEALVTTELGLVVAVPTLLLHAYINRRHQAYLAQLEADTVLLGELSNTCQEAA
ncbi:MotA/TolQ/ExbB proton channel family protein [Endozoicomonas euniceicola]|uniref:MotA/TolQ/ExbB proton channel family protein n=1 Tax=Endozoicomonas euniceicola TaxID=1234143 RepID=A0ABY6GNZ9_9GAMM|nr:MotA/TolQ/ExbB proton channel family protein [Endozoicomonas euniceicola]UYM14478.1 MotA/TolQ/ExbB proton channel family protein [Endozoicomonas euniceicola]